MARLKKQPKQNALAENFAKQLLVIFAHGKPIKPDSEAVA